MVTIIVAVRRFVVDDDDDDNILMGKYRHNDDTARIVEVVNDYDSCI